VKQVLQNLRTGEIELADVPCPSNREGHILIQTRASLISAGSERTIVEFSQASIIQKARQQPEKVKQALDKMRTDGILPTVEAIFRRLDEPLPLGYCNAGEVIEVGPGVPHLRPGDRVLSNGPHAEIVCVPVNLVAKIPDEIPHEEAAFGVLGSIALQGIRLAAPTLGERFVVFGMGLIGLLTVQLLQANGCHVLAVDPDNERLAIAKSFGAEICDISSEADPVISTTSWSNGRGVDGALITASAKTDVIVHQAAQACRKRGRIILVGVVGLNLRRNDFYEKELTFQVSCSYGPGRYDENYEQKGNDYPLGFVRWTEQRNFATVLEMMSAKRVNSSGLITHRFPLKEIGDAYSSIQNSPNAFGVILEYPNSIDLSQRIVLTASKVKEISQPGTRSEPVVGVIGAGVFSKNTLLPSLTQAGAIIKYIASLGGVSAAHAAQRFRGGIAVTDYKEILRDPEVRAVLISVEHNLHARFVKEALAAGKTVFVEKPLAMNVKELDEISDTLDSSRQNTGPDYPHLVVGFNRRFSPHIIKMKDQLASRAGPLCMSMTINSGEIPADHWTQDTEVGGGRIIGECCHFIDLLAHLADSNVVSVAANMVGEGPAVRNDKMSIILRFADGSLGNINYFSNGSKKFPKETLEVFSDGRVLRMENFRSTKGFGFKGFRDFRTRRQDKGHDAEFSAFVDSVSFPQEPLMPYNRLVNVTLATFAVMKSSTESAFIFL
jgi:predicted dehydrogenase/threonine dehydrogenase-like Zn-dependent dehydrogenase